MQKKFEAVLSENELLNLVQILPKTGVILLQGNLACGKTTLAKAIVKSRGFKDTVSSPTFSLMQNYGEIYHYDIYRVGFNAITQNGLFENIFEDGLHLIEWGDDNLIKALKKYEMNFYIVKITAQISENKRKYEVFYA